MYFAPDLEEDLKETTGAELDKDKKNDKKNPKNGSGIFVSELDGILHGAGSIICAIKGTCAGTTVIQPPPTPAASKKESNLGLILGLVIGFPLVAFLGVFIWKWATKK